MSNEKSPSRAEKIQAILEAANELREEGEGNRGAFYELYGSAIHPSLIPLADLLEATAESHTDQAFAVAVAIW